MVKQKVPDIRVALRMYRDQISRLIAAGVEKPDTSLIDEVMSVAGTMENFNRSSKDLPINR